MNLNSSDNRTSTDSTLCYSDATINGNGFIFFEVDFRETVDAVQAFVKAVSQWHMTRGRNGIGVALHPTYQRRPPFRACRGSRAGAPATPPPRVFRVPRPERRRQSTPLLYAGRARWKRLQRAMC